VNVRSDSIPAGAVRVKPAFDTKMHKHEYIKHETLEANNGTLRSHDTLKQ